MTKEDVILTIGSIVGTGAFSTLITLLLTRKKTFAESTKINSEADKLDEETENVRAEIILTFNKATLEQIKFLKEQVGIARDENHTLSKINSDLNLVILDLQHQMEKMNKHLRDCNNLPH